MRIRVYWDNELVDTIKHVSSIHYDNGEWKIWRNGSRESLIKSDYDRLEFVHPEA